MANLPTRLLALPWIDLPDSLDTLTTLATQVQSVINIAINHPLWAVGLVLLSVVFIQIVVDLIKRILKASLTFVLKLPLTLSQWVWQRLTTPAQPSSKTQVSQLISRLEALRQEQDQVVAELKALLSSAEPPAGALTSLTQSPSVTESAVSTTPEASRS
ncbi:MAG: hypothetical protein WA885_22340 [Phormidesmis sp.]